jgi:NTE family protein
VIEPRVSLALGGGAAKGLAHVGVLLGLEEDGVEVAAIAGTSMGSIVGALYARSIAAADMAALFAAVDWRRLGRIMVRSVGGSAFHDLLRETVGVDPIEKLGIPFAAVCCDLANGEEVVLRRGRLADAVTASSAIPGILPPVLIGDRTLVDGAMVTPVPVATAAALFSAPVLAVNVLRPSARDRTVKPMVNRLFDGRAPAPVVAHVERFLSRHRLPFGKRRDKLPNRLEVVMRSFHIMQYSLSQARERAPRVIEPEVGAIGWFEFERATDIIAEGYRAYRAASDRG